MGINIAYLVKRHEELQPAVFLVYYTAALYYYYYTSTNMHTHTHMHTHTTLMP